MFFVPLTQKQSFFSWSANALRSIKTGTVIAMLASLFLAACGDQASRSETVIVSTLAGSEGGFVDGEGSAAQFKGPAGIAIDAAGNLYVADMWNHRIRKVTPKGKVSTLAAIDADDVAIDAAGNLYVADRWNHRIRTVTPKGDVRTLAGGDEYENLAHYNGSFADGQGSAARFAAPSGIAIDAAGNLYVADTWNNRIRKVTPRGEVSTLAGNDKQGFADGQGSAARFYEPYGITSDAVGNLYVTDSSSHRIRKITPKGEVSTLAGSEEGFADGKGSAARFRSPTGIAIDAAGNLYVADTNNHRIRKVTSKGEVSTLAGSGEKGFADGEGNAARFFEPSGIAIDAEGNLYVTDSMNCRIRKIAIQRP